MLNIGGFTNVSYLPDRDPARVIAFDPGPGNALLDRAARWASGGARALRSRRRAQPARPRARASCVEEWLADPYFARPPPKSTGHERFGEAFFARARDAVLARGGAPDDVFASLARLTVESVARAAERFFPAPCRALDPVRRRRAQPGAGRRLCARGSRPRASRPPTRTACRATRSRRSRSRCSATARAVGMPSNLPAATGAARAVCLGTRSTRRDAFSDASDLAKRSEAVVRGVEAHPRHVLEHLAAEVREPDRAAAEARALARRAAVRQVELRTPRRRTRTR